MEKHRPTTISAKMSQTKLNDGICAAVRAALLQLPSTHQNLWLDQYQILAVLQQGGFKGLNLEVIQRSMKGSRASTLPQRDCFHIGASNEWHYVYKFSLGEKPYRCYKDQHDAHITVPPVSPDWAIHIKEAKYLKHFTVLEEAGYTSDPFSSDYCAVNIGFFCIFCSDCSSFH